MTDKTREAQDFKAAMQSLTHADMPGGNLWEVTTVREKALMLKAWQARATLAAPSAARQWRHLKRQTVYVEESRGELQSAGGPVSEGTRLVSYRGQDGKVWYRPVSEFEDGRFEMLATPAQPPAAQPRNRLVAVLLAHMKHWRREGIDDAAIEVLESVLATAPSVEAEPVSGQQPQEGWVSVQNRAARDVLAERQRQISAEGWTPEHDDEHAGGELRMAAVALALPNPAMWPTTWGGWSAMKDKGLRRNLVRATALMLAEIERLDRASPPEAHGIAPSQGEGAPNA